jgi:arylsulfatase A-like enzyme
MDRRPNILIFCTDEQRGDYLGCMGHPHLKTPNIDRIAAGGTLFRNCYSSSPLCMPARATMMTGLTNRQHGVVDNGINLDRKYPTVPGLLAGAGYRTHAVGKLHLAGKGGRDISEDEDFAEYPERRIYWDWPNHWKGAYYRKFPDNYFGFHTVDFAQGHVNYIFGDYVTWLEENHPGAYAGYKCSNADPRPLAIDPELHYNTWIADRCIQYIREQVSGVSGQVRRAETGNWKLEDRKTQVSGLSPQPFFLWCSFPDPHEPFAAVKKWSDFYDNVEITLPVNTLELSPHSRSETMNSMGLGTQVIDPELVKKSIKQTYGMISHIDEQVGRVLDCLDELGIAENTAVIFISDHGDQLGEHGLFYKSVYPYNAHAHIPFVVKMPGGIKGKVVDDVVSMLDMVPTVFDISGVSYPGQLPGETLAPVLARAKDPVRKSALIEIDRMNTPIGCVQMRALVTNDFKIVCYAPSEEVMLFDRKSDPYELKNLANEHKYQSILDSMRKQLQAELSRTETEVFSTIRT